MTTRSSTPEPPYCWQNKEARRAIREHMNGHESTSAALSLYDALTEIASNEEAETFKAGQPYIGTLSGLSARTVRRIEPILEQVGVVAIERPRMRGHHTYTLLAQGQGVLSQGQGVPTLGQDRNLASCPPVEEQRITTEEHQNNSTALEQKAPKHRSDARHRITVKDLMEMGYDEEQARLLDLYNQKLVPIGYLPVNQFSDEVLRVLESLVGDQTDDIEHAYDQGKPKPGQATFVRLFWNNY